MYCKHCDLKQEEGKFCGKCGGELTEETTIESKVVQTPDLEFIEEAAASEEPVPPVSTSEDIGNDSMEVVKETSRVYGTYFMNFLKQPSRIFTKGETEFKNGIISVAVLAVLIALSFYMLFNNLLSASYGGYGFFTEGVPFLPIFGNVLLFTSVLMVIIITLLFLVNKLFGSDSSYKEIFSVFGAHMNPLITLIGLAFILILIKSNGYGTVLLFVTFALIIILVPLYLISSLLTKKSKGVDPLYGYLLYIVFAGITFTILLGILADSMIGELIDEISYWL